MAYTIVLENCTGCSICELACPNSAIMSNDDGLYQIDPDLCTECVGHFDEAQCNVVCPIELTCIPDPACVEDRDMLMARKIKLHGS